jgi:isopenicillin N synthase-like dioxygenase
VTLPPRLAIRSIPIVDIGGLASADFAERSRVAWQIHRACRDAGFFYIANHGVPGALVEAQFEAARRLFALPDAVKRAAACRPEEPERGFGVSPESFGHAGEWHDGPRNIWPEGSDDLRAQLEAYHAAIASVAGRLLRAFALSLNLAEDWFAEGFEGVRPAMRLMRYPPLPKDAPPGAMGVAAHTDRGALTVLCQDEVGGLEVCGAEGDWIPATPIPGTFVVNLGDMVRRWSNEMYRSTPHRVAGNRSGRDRYSIAAFFNPRRDYVVRCVPTCLPEDGAPAYPPCTSGEHLDAAMRRLRAG